MPLKSWWHSLFAGDLLPQSFPAEVSDKGRWLVPNADKEVRNGSFNWYKSLIEFILFARTPAPTLLRAPGSVPRITTHCPLMVLEGSGPSMEPCPEPCTGARWKWQA